jgi:hypothetical protein
MLHRSLCVPVTTHARFHEEAIMPQNVLIIGLRIDSEIDISYTQEGAWCMVKLHKMNLAMPID